ncbi:MAG: hypothetical protein IKM94_04725, partial [Alphaproteobacteria bacterium]|nr:hypothetical protein [Alphaproteobacteria bacterium]
APGSWSQYIARDFPKSKIFANAKTRIAESAGCSVRDVEHIIKQYLNMKRQMAMIQRMGGMEAVMQRMQQNGGMPGGVPGTPGAH